MQPRASAGVAAHRDAPSRTPTWTRRRHRSAGNVDTGGDQATALDHGPRRLTAQKAIRTIASTTYSRSEPGSGSLSPVASLGGKTNWARCVLPGAAHPCRGGRERGGSGRTVVAGALRFETPEPCQAQQPAHGPRRRALAALILSTPRSLRPLRFEPPCLTRLGAKASGPARVDGPPCREVAEKDQGELVIHRRERIEVGGPLPGRTGVVDRPHA